MSTPETSQKRTWGSIQTRLSVRVLKVRGGGGGACAVGESGGSAIWRVIGDNRYRYRVKDLSRGVRGGAAAAASILNHDGKGDLGVVRGSKPDKPGVVHLFAVSRAATIPRAMELGLSAVPGSSERTAGFWSEFKTCFPWSRTLT